MINPSRQPVLASPPSSDPRVQRNKAVVRRVIDEVWNGGDVEALDGLVAIDAVNHTPGAENGLQAVKAHVPELRGGMSDFRLDVTEMVAESDLVYCRLFWSGYHDADIIGFPPSYMWIRMETTATYRLNDEGKICELWQLWDILSMLEEMGMAPPQGAGPAKILYTTLRAVAGTGLRMARKAPPKPPPPAGFPYDAPCGRGA